MASRGCGRSDAGHGRSDAGHGGSAPARVCVNVPARMRPKRRSCAGRSAWKRNPPVPRVLGEQVRNLPAANTETMTGRAALVVCVLALGIAGGAALGGCGGATKTVSVSGAPAVPSATGGTAHTTSTATAPAPTKASSGTVTSSTVTQSEAGQASATRTAPAPAFARTGTQPGEEAANAEAGVAADVVTAHGYTPRDISDYHPSQTLRVLLGTRTGAADGNDQHAFFFLDNRFIGTDAAQPSASIHIVSQSDTEVTLAYALYRSHDPLCCPSGGRAVVHFQLDNGTLVPLQPLPPVTSATGLARQ
jgi:LppP/LprE lipoprotein